MTFSPPADGKPRQLPGFYYDEAKKRYFRLQPGQRPPPQESQQQQEQEKHEEEEDVQHRSKRRLAGRTAAVGRLVQMQRLGWAAPHRLQAELNSRLCCRLQRLPFHWTMPGRDAASLLSSARPPAPRLCSNLAVAAGGSVFVQHGTEVQEYTVRSSSTRQQRAPVVLQHTEWRTRLQHSQGVQLCCNTAGTCIAAVSAYARLTVAARPSPTSTTAAFEWAASKDIYCIMWHPRRPVLAAGLTGCCRLFHLESRIWTPSLPTTS